MDDSISLSPTCSDDSSINLSKERRKKKRQCTKKTQVTDHDYTRSPAGDCRLNGGDNVSSLKDTFLVPVTENWLKTDCDAFNPEADWLDCSQAQSKCCAKQNFLLTQGQGFVKFDVFALSQARSADKSGYSHPRSEVHCNMTNTELIDICNVVERNCISSNKLKGKKEKEKENSIVEIILDDFCTLPSYQEDWFNEANDPTPYFRFSDKIILTYSRVRNDRSITILEPDDDDCISNCSSGLSVQEDHTVQWSTTHPTNFNPNTSDKLCQNLLNLSAFFTQNAKQDDSVATEATSQIKYVKMENCSDLDLSLESDTQIQQENFTSDKENNFIFRQSMPLTFIDYHWFLVEDEPKISDCEFIANPDDTQIFFKTQPENYRFSTAGSHSDLQSLNTNDCNKAKLNDKFEQQDFNLSDEYFDHDDSFSKFMNNEVLNKTIKSQECGTGLTNKGKCVTISDNNGDKNTPSLPKSQYFEEWNEDCDEFINYNTEELLNKSASQQGDTHAKSHKTSSSYEHIGFCTASQKPISISESAKQRAKNILEELPEIDGLNDEFLKNTDDSWFARDARAYKLKEEIDVKPCTSKQAIERVNQLRILKELDIGNINLNEWSPENTQCDKTGPEVACLKLICKSENESQFELNTSTQLKGNILTKQVIQSLKHLTSTSEEPELAKFLTASQKPITISNEAMKRAVHILCELPEIPLKDFKEPKQKYTLQSEVVLTDECKEIKNQILENMTVETIVSGEFQSEEDIPKKHDIKPLKNCNTGVEEPQCVGFLTASQKSISISSEAMKKAVHILSELPEIPLNDLNEPERKSSSKHREALTGKSNETKKHMLETLAVETSASKKFKSETVLKNQKHVKKDISTNQDIQSLKDVTSSTSSKEPEFVSFFTASQKNICISNEAMKKAVHILSELPEIPMTEFNEPEQKPSSKNQNALTDENIKKRRLGSTAIETSAPTKFKSEIDQELVGFLTASKKNISISNEAMKRATKILSELPEIPSKESIEPEQKSMANTKEALTMGIDSTFSESPVSVTKIQKSASFELKTPQTPVECGQLKSSLSELPKYSPLNSCKASSVISRKNLLSLSKRRKLKHTQSGLLITSSAIKKTKSLLSQEDLIESTGITPKRNTDTFCNTVLATSTPRPFKPVNETLNNFSSDFQKINWDNTNVEGRNLSESTRSKETQANQNPSASERIERLSMYGDPSPISPIPITTRSINRRLGLSRIRSSNKK